MVNTLETIAEHEVREANPVLEERGWSRRLSVPVALGIVALVYVAGLLLVDPRGHLLTDVGGKVASMEAMINAGSIDPDIGYWFEDADPDGSFHPLAHTRRTSEGSWINTTSMTMLLIALPLWELGGNRAALVIPLLGSFACAAVSGRLSRQLRPRYNPGPVVLLTGLASPAVIYAFDFWEHSWGLALTTFAASVAHSVATDEEKTRVGQAMLAGFAVGLAATMRQESLVYAFVIGLVLSAGLIRSRGLVRATTTGATFTAGFVVPLAAHALIETWLFGDIGARISRGGTTLTSAGSAVSDRLNASAVFLFGARPSVAIGVGLVAVAASVAFKHRSGIRPWGRTERIAGISVLMWLVIGPIVNPGWLPGLFIATPLAIFGVFAAVESRHHRALAAIALGPIPLVLLTAFTPGPTVQWGARYLLPTALLLLVFGFHWLRDRSTELLVAVIAVSSIISITGLVWTLQRSHDIGDMSTTITATTELSDVVVWQRGTNAREFGGLSIDRLWLSAELEDERSEVARLLEGRDVTSFISISQEQPAPPTFDGFEPAELLGDLDPLRLHIRRYVATGGQ